jgi:hypothetical protein
MIAQVPADTNQVHLPILLRPFIEKLAPLGRSIAVAFIHHKLKPRFGLTYADVRAYSSELAKVREALERTERECKAQEAAAAQAEPASEKR